MKSFCSEKSQATNCSSIRLERHRSERRDGLQCIEHRVESVRCGADERHAPDQLCPCITRPAMSNEQLQCNAAGQVVLKLKGHRGWMPDSDH
jgi:hypothetical protein